MGGALRCETARVVAKAFLILVGAVVFFVDYDQTQVWKRRKQRAARTDCDWRGAPLQALPLLQAFARSQAVTRTSRRCRRDHVLPLSSEYL